MLAVEATAKQLTSRASPLRARQMTPGVAPGGVAVPGGRAVELTPQEPAQTRGSAMPSPGA